MVKKLNRGVLEALSSTEAPDLAENQFIGRIEESRGKGMFVVQIPGNKSVLADLATRFKSALWIHRGTFVVVQVESGTETGLERGTIESVLNKEQIKDLKRLNRWPEEFVQETETREVRPYDPLAMSSTDEEEYEEESGEE